MVQIPVMALKFTKPVDGLPLLHLWLATAKDVWHRGFENWREPLEVKLVTDMNDITGTPMALHCLAPVKGLGRLSMILWAMLWTYLHKDNLDGDAKDDFVRP